MAVTAAQLNVIISATGAKEVISDLNQLDGQVKKAAGGFDAFYDRIGGGAGNALRALDGVARVMGSIAVIGGVSLIAGGAKAAWDQVSAVEQATVALRAYESDAGAVNQVLEELIAYARSDMGVLFQRQDLFQAAQGLKMYGAETSRLTEYVKIMSRSVGLGLSTWTDLNRVIGRVGATGRLAGDDFDYLRAAGFMLDDSLRNTNITFEELFDAMDRGIPANALEGQAETIRGAMIRLQTGLRNIGLAFLDVDADTSKFVEGGLGDKLRNALFDARGWIDNFTDAARTIGNGIASAIEAVENMAAAYQSLPGWMQTAIESITKLVVAFGALRVAGSALGLVMNVAGLGGLVGGVQSLAGAFTSAGGGAVGFRAALAGLLGAINPVGLAIAGVGIGLTALAVMWGKQQREIKATEQALDAMTDSYLDLIIARNEARVAGDLELDRQLQQLQVQVSYITQMSQEVEEMYQNFGKLNGVQYSDAEMKAFREQYELTADEINRLTDAQNLLSAAFQDTRIDGLALSGALQEIYDEFARGNITGSQAVDMIEDLSQNTSRYVIVVEEATAATSRFSDVMGVINDEAKSWADTIMNLNTISDEDSFITRLLKAAGTSAGDRAGIASFINEIGSVYSALDDMPGPDASHADWMEWVNEAEHGTYVWRLRVDEATAALQAQDDQINSILPSLEQMQNMLKVAGMDDPLSQWNLSGNATDMSLLAMNTQRASDALENTFRVVVGNTNAFASQAQGVEDWIASLATAEEGLTKLDELLQGNLITQTEYNAAMQAHTDIAAANASIQENVLAIQAQQAPIIAEQTRALADYIEHIAGLPAHQQRAALGWMDAATAGQAFELQALAIAAASGQMGDAGMDMAGTMIASLAMVNPYLAAMLEDIGLISMGADGTITIHWSGLQEGLSDFDRLSVMFLEFMNLVSDTPITFEMLGLDDPRQKLEDIEDTTHRLADNQVNIPVGIEEEGGGIAPGVDALVSGIVNHYASNPITIPVEIQTRSKAASVGQSAGEVARGALDNMMADVTVTVSADTSVADSRLQTVSDNLATLRNAETPITIDVVDNASPVLDSLVVRLYGFNGLISTTTLDADSSPLDGVMKTAGTNLSNYSRLTSTTTLDADKQPAQDVLEDIQRQLVTYDGFTYVTTLDANSASANLVLRLLEGRLNEFDNRTVIVYIHAIDFATSTINSVTRSLNDLNGKSATTYVNQVVRGQGAYTGFADGGIVREPVVLVGERGPELVALPYGSEVFSNTETMSMLRSAVSSRNSSNRPVVSQSPSHSGGTQIIDNTTHNETYITLNDAQFAELLQAKDKANAVHGDLKRGASRQYTGSIR